MSPGSGGLGPTTWMVPRVLCSEAQSPAEGPSTTHTWVCKTLVFLLEECVCSSAHSWYFK